MSPRQLCAGLSHRSADHEAQKEIPPLPDRQKSTDHLSPLRDPGCQYYVLVKDGKVVDTEAYNGPSNKGLLCVKGRSGSFDFAQSPERIKYPLIKNHETGEFERATWDEALDLVASKFMEIKKQYGPDSLAGFACSRSPNEDIYMVQKMVRTCFGTNNTDNCARVCHSASVSGLYMTLAPAP